MKLLHFAHLHPPLPSTSTTSKIPKKLPNSYNHKQTHSNIKSVKMACSCCTTTTTTVFVCSCGYREATQTVCVPSNSAPAPTGFVEEAFVVSRRSSRSHRSHRHLEGAPSVVESERRSSRSAAPSHVSRHSQSQPQGQPPSRLDYWLESVPEGSPASAVPQRLLPAPSSRRGSDMGSSRSSSRSSHASSPRVSQISSSSRRSSTLAPEDSASQVPGRVSRRSSSTPYTSEQSYPDAYVTIFEK
ncbi:hypothetical protein BJX96DRAFT_156845 [Aspergillus floccosus]